MITQCRFDDRTRFNWGFHDATFDGVQGWPDRRVDPSLPGTNLRRPLPADDFAYCSGYSAGWESWLKLGIREESSERAWLNQFVDPVQFAE